MRVAGRLAAEVLEMIEPHVKAGVTTEELDRICHDYITNEQGCIPAPLNYHGFPKSICTSINHIVCHGIPAEKDGNEGQKFSKTCGTKRWRHHQHRCDCDQRRLPRRHIENV